MDCSKSENDGNIILKSAQYGKKSEFVAQSNQKPVSVQATWEFRGGIFWATSFQK